MNRPSASPLLTAAEDRRARRTGFLFDFASWIFYGCVLVTLLSAGYLVYAIYGFTTPSVGAYSPQDIKRLHDMVELVGNVYLGATLLGIASAALLFFEEEVFGYLLLILAGIVYWGIPIALQFFIGNPRWGHGRELSGLALQKIQLSMWAYAVPASLFIVIDIVMRVVRRIRYGVRSDVMQYGGQMREEADVSERFLGKCWQLPYCRKFIRQRCPIFHARRACWRERVGCMCEEEVISNAMKTVQVFSRDRLANAQYIPYNNKLPMWVKKERCRNCIIYNERQRQKYKLAAPVVVGGLIGSSVLFHDQIIQVMIRSLASLDVFMKNLSVAPASAQATKHASLAQWMQSTSIAAEVLLICTLMIALGYSLRLVEFLVFKLKV